MMDATASMTSNIAAAKDNVAIIVNKVREAFKTATVRVAFVAYRDYSENKPSCIYSGVRCKQFEIFEFTENIPKFVEVLGKVRAYRGRDIPEDVLGALSQTINLKWQAANKLFFQIGILLIV